MAERLRCARAVAAVAALACLAFGASGCKVRVGNGEPGRMAAKGPETWSLDGRMYSIGSTYYVVLPPGEQLQYTIEYIVSDPRMLDGINDERAAQIAMPLMKHDGSSDCLSGRRSGRRGPAC